MVIEHLPLGGLNFLLEVLTFIAKRGAARGVPPLQEKRAMYLLSARALIDLLLRWAFVVVGLLFGLLHLSDLLGRFPRDLLVPLGHRNPTDAAGLHSSPPITFSWATEKEPRRSVRPSSSA